MVRKARLDDVPVILNLINEFAEQGEMLFRAPPELYEHLRDFFVIERDGAIVGCCALEIMSRDLAEIKSLSVRPDQQRQGGGRELVQACIAEASELGLGRVFALTRSQEFFERIGFHVVDRETLPHKIWDDCLRCPRQDECDEIAVLRFVDAAD